MKLISSYLSERKQAVSIEGVLSDFLPLTKGVPQGSILGPLLFSVYINDIASVILNSSKHIYADDIQIYQSCPLGLIENCASDLNEELQRISNWSSKSSLVLNPGKCKCLVISKTTLDLTYFPHLMLNGSKIEFVDSSKNLGIVFNRTLTWNNHINSIVGKTYGVLRTLWTAQKCTPTKTRLLLAKALVIPLLIYGCEIFYNCDAESKRKLQVAIYTTIRYVYRLKRYDHVSHLAKNLVNMSFQNYIKFRTLLFLFSIIKSKQPTYLYEKIQFPVSSRSACLLLPRFSCLTSERQFYIAAIRLWNTLPRNTRELDDARRFRNELQHFLENQSN